MTLDYFYGQSGELFSYFRIPKALFQDRRFRQLSTDARALYGILLDRMSLSAKNGWLDEQGRVYIIYTVREVQESLCCAEHKAVKLFRENDAGLLLWSVGRIVLLLSHPESTVPRSPFPAALHRRPGTVRYPAGPHEPVCKERLAGRAGAGVYHLYRPGSAGIPLLRRTQGGQAVPGTGGHRPHRAQTPWSGQTQPDLRQGLFLRLAQSASTELPKQQFRCCRKRNSGAAKTASK